MSRSIDRREFLARLGVTMGAATLGTPLAELPVAEPATAADEPGKGRIPDRPVKFGHITILSGPGAVLGAPSLKGHTLAAEEINGAGGLLGKRRIETITADEAAGPDATVKEEKRMKLSEGIDYFSGVIAAHNQLAVGPVVEELKLLTIMTEGCIDKLFEIEVPNPHYLFGMTNILSADGVTTALAVAKAWPDVKRIAVINPDYAFGRWFQLHFDAAREKLLPASEIVSEVWAPFPNTTDFTSHITKTIAAKPDVVVTSMWGGMYVAFYKQALGRGCFAGRGWPATSTSAWCRRRSARTTRRARSPACIPTITSPTPPPAPPPPTAASSRAMASAGASIRATRPRPRTPGSISSRRRWSAPTSRPAAAGRRTTRSFGSSRGSTSRRR